jgi:CRISPR system Cascade subunit CasA
MNGGLGNRPGVGLRDSQDLGAAFRRDVGVLLRQREQVCDDAGFGSAGTALLWCLPWDGKRSAVFATLDPWVVECCRRIRLIDEGGITARMAPTQAARVATSDAFTGNAGDPWTPINAKTNKSLTLPKDGFTYKRVADLLLNGDWAAPAAQIPQPGDGPDLRWYGRALVRGQGKTEGWHEREVPIDRRIGKRFAQRDEREALGKRAQEMITNAGVMRLGILKPALVTLWHEAEGRVEPALRRLEQRIDHEFFPVLWNTDADLTAWRTALKTWAQEILDAEISTVAETASRWRRISEATSQFDYGLHRKTHKDIKAMFLPLTTVSTP